VTVVERNGRLVHHIQQLLAAHLHTDGTDPDLDLLETGVVDSVSLVELVLALEREFQIELPFDELEIDDFRTVRRVAALVDRTPRRPPA